MSDDVKRIFDLIKLQGFPERQAQYITSQAAFETGGFTSDIYKENHNLFGMKNAGQSLVIGENRGHAIYASDEDSIKDYAKYYRNHKYLPFYVTMDSFVLDLKKEGYFESDIMRYLRGMQHYYKSYFLDDGKE